MKIVLFDLDHTICDSAWRDPLMAEGWDSYHSKLENDKVFSNVVDLIDRLSFAGYTCIGFTMRPEKWRDMTIRHLYKNDVNIQSVLMRASNDYSPANTTKVTMVREQFNDEQRAAIKFIVDDREDVCSMFTKEFGISTLQIRHGTKS